MCTFALSAFASLAFGLFCSAAPVNVGLDSPSDTIINIGVAGNDNQSGLTGVGATNILYNDLRRGLDVQERDPSVDAPVGADVLGVVLADVEVDLRELKTLDSILDGVVSAVDEIAEEVGKNLFIPLAPIVPDAIPCSATLTTATATVKVVTDIFGDLKTILTSAIADVKAISVKDILKSITGDLLDLKAVAELVAAVLTVCTPFPALGFSC